MDEKIKSAIKFYLLATKLKYKIRAGWDKNHWNINSDRLESIAEHVYRTCILALSFNSQFDFNIDINIDDMQMDLTETLKELDIDI